MNKQLLQSLETISSRLSYIESTMVTKEDLTPLATKKDLDEEGTRIIEDLSQIINEYGISTDRRKATKEEVALLEARITQVEQKFTA